MTTYLLAAYSNLQEIYLYKHSYTLNMSIRQVKMTTFCFVFFVLHIFDRELFIST